MPPLRREPDRYSRDDYDLVIVGGGIQGVVLLLEASLTGLRVILLEGRDFGSQTSWNALRIVHGGLRYLQHLNLGRFRESVRSRSWFLRSFPDHTRPLACVMPLYDRGLKRPFVMRAALRFNDLLSARRNVGLPGPQRLGRGRVLTRNETLAMSPLIDPAGLAGSALWYDGVVEQPSRVLIEILLRSRSAGARALNYVEAVRVETAEGRVRAVEAVDSLSGATYRFRTARVALCVGADPARVRQLTGLAMPPLPAPALAWNLVLRKPLPIRDATALASMTPDGDRALFVHNQGGLALAGTGHAPIRDGAQEGSTVSEDQISGTLSELNAAIPAWDVSRRDVARVLGGIVPAGQARGLEPVWQADGEMAGLFGVNTVKYTTSVSVAHKTLRAMGLGPRISKPPENWPPTRTVPTASAFLDLSVRHPAKARALVDAITQNEAVQNPQDLVLRRTDWGLDPNVEEETMAAIENLAAGER